MSSTNISTALSEAQRRTVTIVTSTGESVKYSNNPAELPGVRHEIDECLRRTGAFELLIKHGASRLPNGKLAVEDVNNIPFVTGAVDDPLLASYTYANPCPDTPARVNAFNAIRPAAGLTAYTGISGGVGGIPPTLLQLAIPAPAEVAIEDHAYALTQLSIWEDQTKANALLLQCGRSGRRLRALLDALERTATPEDVTLVTERRNSIVNTCLLYTSPSPRDRQKSRMPSSA